MERLKKVIAESKIGEKSYSSPVAAYVLIGKALKEISGLNPQDFHKEDQARLKKATAALEVVDKAMEAFEGPQ